MLLQCLVCLSILSGVRLKGMAFSTMIFCIQQPGFATYPHVSTIIKQLWGLLKSGYLLTNLWDRTLNFITLWLIAGFSPTLSNESLLSVFDLHMRSHSRIHSQMLLVSYTNYEQTILWGLQLCQHSYCCTRPKTHNIHIMHSFFFIRINLIRILRLKITREDGNLRINNGKVEAQGNFKYSYKKRVYKTTNSGLYPKWPWVHLPFSRKSILSKNPLTKFQLWFEKLEYVPHPTLVHRPSPNHSSLHPLLNLA